MSESTCIVELRESRTSTLKRIPLNRLNRANIDPDGVKKFLAQQFYQARGPDVLSESKFKLPTRGGTGWPGRWPDIFKLQTLRNLTFKLGSGPGLNA